MIIAGPNGSGKSSVYHNADIEMNGRSIRIVNPDLLAAKLSTIEGVDLPKANLLSVVRIEAWLDASIAVHQTVGVETVLSTGKYRRLVDAAHRYGFEVWLLYVVLDSVERNLQRVRLRVKKGGHDVPEDSIRGRYKRSLEQLPWFLEKADRAWIFDNSGAQPRLIGEKTAKLIKLDKTVHPRVLAAAQQIESGEPIA